MKKWERAINICIQLAENNTAKFRLGSVALDKKGVICSIGVNSTKSHPMMAALAKEYGHKDQIGLHAECESILRSKVEIHSLVVVRLLKNGKIANAAPCPICSELIRRHKIKNVIYSNSFENYTWEKRA